MEYRVLARKYRPAVFADLIGQEVLVRTFANAIATGRIHHAFVLTGIRGIGKTTTARLIARALNCIGPDGNGGPTVSPCGVCTHCTMIAESRHPDVPEMDAASRTGVGDIRDLIDTVQYAPSSARYKIYIIDEVHMLSASAFNALLKTLEEPPPHVKFIFATTEARKIPVTILSRCQRFDLKRVGTEVLAAHLNAIAQKEGARLAPSALTLLAASAEGSVRDGLSLLDQAIAHQAQGGGDISEEEVRAMLGLADRSQVVALFTLLAQGEVAACLAQLRALHEAGADALMVLQDLLEFTHFVTRLKHVPALEKDIAYAEHERKAAAELAGALSVPVLARLWQMLLKGLAEARRAPLPVAAVEMVLVRAAYAAELPTPAEALRALEKKTEPPAAATAPAADIPPVESFADAVAALERAREMLLASQLRQFAAVVSFKPGALCLAMRMTTGRDFTSRLAAALWRATGLEWSVTLAETADSPTLHEQEMARKEKQKQEAAAHPLVESVLRQFPGAEIIEVKETA
ncbi:MAG: DNA polymerase III subunit gamma/tau [Alphaproteobacteria bacterium]|nr:DNA polymerase III subunit gamma/tau [Alphaproteobacteria bacterium]